jgi:hypothetical protein
MSVGVEARMLAEGAGRPRLDDGVRRKPTQSARFVHWAADNQNSTGAVRVQPRGLSSQLEQHAANTSTVEEAEHYGEPTPESGKTPLALAGIEVSMLAHTCKRPIRPRVPQKRGEKPMLGPQHPFSGLAARPEPSIRPHPLHPALRRRQRRIGGATRSGRSAQLGRQGEHGWQSEIDRIAVSSADKASTGERITGLPTIAEHWPELANVLAALWTPNPSTTDKVTPDGPAAVAPKFPEPEDRGFAVLSERGKVEYVKDFGVRPGRIVVVAAEEGTGKSHAIVDELALRVAHAGGSFAGTWPIVQRGNVLVLSEMHSDDDWQREEVTLASLDLCSGFAAFSCAVSCG